jgi:hypothetical protein
LEFCFVPFCVYVQTNVIYIVVLTLSFREINYLLKYFWNAIFPLLRLQ